MKEADVELFIAAIKKEIYDHQLRDHWSVVKRSTIPQSTKTIQADCSFKQKRFTDGCLNKHTYCLCARGGMQECGENYWETYSPVVNMLTVRLLLALCNIQKLESKSID